MWSPGDLLQHRHNPDLGPGRVVEVGGSRVLVEFPESDETLGFVADSEALIPLTLSPGSQARIEATGETVVLAQWTADGRWRLTDGRVLPVDSLWPIPAVESPVQGLARGKVDSSEDFRNRLDALGLEELRQADGLGSFLGGRIRLYPHQLHAAEAACRSDPVRWLLADGVGLGKTVEACLIMNRLIHTGRAERVLVVAPEALTVQWLGELWRKHHQIFVLIDQKRIDDVAKDQGEDFNPFEVHRRAIIAMERLAADPLLVDRAVTAGIDLLVVDEAHHLQRLPGHPGNPAYRAVAEIAAQQRGVLLLTATPLENDTCGFLRLVQLLRPDLLAGDDLVEQLEAQQQLPACTSATRAADIGGWPPRIGIPVEPGSPESWQALLQLELEIRSQPAQDPLSRRRKIEQAQRALASAAALVPMLDRSSSRMTTLLAAAGSSDPRVSWLLAQALEWRKAGDKTLVFVAHRETLDMLREQLAVNAHLRAGIFHEDLSTARRDLEVARFRAPDGPALLISTECGGEGRNFEFCRRLVLFDLPWKPAMCEQRIGRLDRIGRSRPTEVVYFRPPGGLSRALVELYESIGIFEGSLGSLDRQLEQIAGEVETVALGDAGEIYPDVFAQVLQETRAARSRIEEAAFHELHCNRYRKELAGSILARVPPELETITAELVLRAAARFGYEVEQQRGRNTWYIELGTESLVDQLPGVPAGARFLGTFDREEAVENESLDFFASGHPLVEGILAELAQGSSGRTACLQLTGPEDLFGLLAIYSEGHKLEAIAVDTTGKLRPEIAERLISPGFRSEHVRTQEWTSLPGWQEAIERMAKALPDSAVPQAVAAWRSRLPG
jgi:ATP-dependent helicase HepA